jgi:hypothetical protein
MSLLSITINLSTMGACSQLLQGLTELMKSNTSLKRSQSFNPPQCCPPTGADSEPSSLEHSLISTTNSGSELSISDSFPQSQARSRPQWSVVCTITLQAYPAVGITHTCRGGGEHLCTLYIYSAVEEISRSGLFLCVNNSSNNHAQQQN